jgi:SAM-dependent methyltransferase
MPDTTRLMSRANQITGSVPGAAWYDENAASVASGYESLDPKSVHPELFEMLEDRADLRILDIGTGSGRDAKALACLGHRVVAVDPSIRMIELARAFHPDSGVEWVVEGLPALDNVDGEFDLVILSAVWMHVPPADRPAAFRRLLSLIGPGGMIYVTLRTGPDDLQRAMYFATPNELERLAEDAGLSVTKMGERPDLLGRSGVSWHTLAMSKPN